MEPHAIQTVLARAVAEARQRRAADKPSLPAAMLGLLWLGVRIPPVVAKDLAIQGYEDPEKLHLTIAMFEVTPQQSQDVIAQVAKFCETCDPLDGVINGHGRFSGTESSGGKDVVYASFDCTQLTAFRQGLIDAACKVPGVEPLKTHGYIPHITLAYVSKYETVSVDVVPQRLEFTALSVSYGGQDMALPMVGGSDDIYKADIITKADEKRFTLQVVYKATNDITKPVYDAHGEFMMADDLQEAEWSFIRNNKDRVIYVQHGLNSSFGFRVGGELLEIMSLPWEQECTFVGVSGKQERRIIPANSIYAGIQWTPEVWNSLVKTGKLKGLSFGGFARRLRMKSEE